MSFIAFKQVPMNYGPIKEADANAKVKGPCGDTMEFWIRVEDGTITRTGYTTDGCIHSILCGSAMATLALGKTFEMIDAIDERDIMALVNLSPVPIDEESQHCAKLAKITLKATIENYRN